MDWILQIPLSVKVLVVTGVAYLMYGQLQSRRTDRKIRSMGGYAHRKVSYVMGLDIIYEILTAYAKNDVLGYWNRKIKLNPRANPNTFELGSSSIRAVMTADHENIKAILATQFEDFGKGERLYLLWYEFLGDGIFMTDGNAWHESRKLLRPQFIKDRVSNLKVFERHVCTLLPMLGGNGQTIDLSTLLFRYTLDAATDFLFGRSADTLVKEDAAFGYAFDTVQYIQSLKTRAGRYGSLVASKKQLREQLAILNHFMSPFIEEALSLSADELAKVEASDESYTLLHALAAHTKNRQLLRDHLVSVLLAGRDTTACTLSWLFYELSTHPRTVRKLRKEILQQVGAIRAPTYTDLKAMRYLQHTMNETLRLYPVVPYNGRVSLCDTTLPRGGGPDGMSPIGILKGTMVNWSTLAMQRREDLYPVEHARTWPVHEFHPERWNHWTPKSWTYVPFNGGPRICIGQQFALTEMAYTVTRLLQRFDGIEYRGDGHPGMKTDIVLAPAKPVKVAFYAVEETEKDGY